jgi:adenylate kinase
MGPPGAGKGTQAKLLAAEHGWIHLSTGDLFRDHLGRGSELGKLAQQHMGKGAYVPDDVTVGMVRERIAAIAPSTRILFDGFPRTPAQAASLDELLEERGRSIGAVILLDVPDDVLVERLGLRGRADDAPDVVRRRLGVYIDETNPVVEHYERRGIVRRVPGVGAVDEIHQRIEAALL